MPKNDHFFTEYNTVANELSHYKAQLAGQVIYKNQEEKIFTATKRKQERRKMIEKKTVNAMIRLADHAYSGPHYCFIDGTSREKSYAVVEMELRPTNLLEAAAEETCRRQGTHYVPGSADFWVCFDERSKTRVGHVISGRTDSGQEIRVELTAKEQEILFRHLNYICKRKYGAGASAMLKDARMR